MDHNFKDILHNVNLTEGQISTILFCLEGYVAGLDDVVTQNENDKEEERICEELETKLYNAQEQDLLRSVTNMGGLN